MNDKDYPVTLLKGTWPEWFGNVGMRFVYVRIRNGQVLIGLGSSHTEAFEKAVMVFEDERYTGVTEIWDAIASLRREGFQVRSMVVPEHVEEIAD